MARAKKVGSSVEVKSNVELVKDQLMKALNEAAEMIGGIIEGHAKELCPVDTGLLRNSIIHTRSGKRVNKVYLSDIFDENNQLKPHTSGRYDFEILPEEGEKVTVIVGTNVKYAPFVELGHMQEPGRFVPAIGKRLKASHVAARPFLRPAWENNMDEINQALHLVLVKHRLDT
ncbi:MAG: HK97 gp10 family phage protein [Bacteroidales bacterium]|nr:HK97 gp10 family phage protein [Bacteroidales bacterium]